jgi:hypothetical protein
MKFDTISIHDDVDNECCPDFSCCNKNINTPIAKRKEFLRIYNLKGSDGCTEMLVDFLGNSIKASGYNVTTSGR